MPITRAIIFEFFFMPSIELGACHVLIRPFSPLKAKSRAVFDARAVEVVTVHPGMVNEYAVAAHTPGHWLLPFEIII